MVFRRGDIYLVKFSGSRGIEPGKVRPAIIFQSQELLDLEYPTVIVISLTTHLKGGFPLRVRIRKRDKLEKDSDAMIDQVRAIDARRIIPERLASLKESEVKIIEEALLVVLGIGL